MKQTIKRWLGLASLAFVSIAGLLVASPAQAAGWTQYTYSAVGGPGDANCYKLVTPLPPAVSAFTYCGSTAPNSETNLQYALAALTLIPNGPATLLAHTAYTVYYYQNMSDYCEVQYNPNTGISRDTQCQDTYIAKGQNTAGDTQPLGNGANRTAFSEIFENYPSGAYPLTAFTTDEAHIVLHEAGHAWDWVLGTVLNSPNGYYASQTNQSQSGTPLSYLSMYALDYYRNGQCIAGSVWDNDHSVASYARYFICAQSGQPSAPYNVVEMFAEEFAMGVSSQYTSSPQYESAPASLDISAIYDSGLPQGVLCANTWVWYYMLYNTAPTESWYQFLGIETSCYGTTQNFNTKNGG